jgi:hypothetical protein
MVHQGSEAVLGAYLYALIDDWLIDNDIMIL